MPFSACSAPCSRFCSDTTSSKTFCINDRAGEGGICVAKCSADSDCRPGYSCQLRARFNESTIQKKVCVPDNVAPKTCVEELVDMIETQRAYEVNSKMIKSTDEMLQYANQNL